MILTCVGARVGVRHYNRLRVAASTTITPPHTFCALAVKTKRKGKGGLAKCRNRSLKYALIQN
jgi:hypothetical protein